MVPMLESRSHDWLSRLRGHGPALVSAGLAVLIAVELARIALTLVGPVRRPEPAISGALAPAPAGVSVQDVVSAHLFGIAAPSAAGQDPGNAPVSRSNLVLAGTIATDDPRHGVAIISDGGPSKVYSVGDNVGGAALHSVFLDRVILDRGGVLETLPLPRTLPPGHSTAAVKRMTGVDPRTVAAVDNIRRMVQQDPGLLDQAMRVVPSYDSSAGKLRGFRAYPGRNRAIFGKLGLKPGDLVTAINGTALDDPQRSQEVFNTIQTSDRVTVTVDRGGQRQDITLNIAQVAGEATKELEGEQGQGAGSPTPAAVPPGAPQGEPASGANPLPAIP